MNNALNLLLEDVTNVLNFGRDFEISLTSDNHARVSDSNNIVVLLFMNEVLNIPIAHFLLYYVSILR